MSDETAPTITSGATAAFTELVANTHALASDDASAAFAIVSTNVTGNPAPSVSGSTLSWTPSEEQGGTGAAYRVTVSATDASDNVGTQDVIITVAETNEDPVLADIGSRSASPGAELVISLSATDTDVPQNALAYARNGTAGAITATDSRAASFAWTPTGSDLGAHVIRFTVSDGAGGTDSEGRHHHGVRRDGAHDNLGRHRGIHGARGQTRTRSRPTTRRPRLQSYQPT